MKVCRPDFYKDFQCISSACRDTCCALWEIEVDEYSAEQYAAHKGPLEEDFRKYLVRKEDENYFRLTADKRCPFLNEQNLCRMILAMGEDYICDICREHPRFYHWFGDYTEVGLGLCCEEAGRLLFSHKDPLKFEILGDEEEALNPDADDCDFESEEDYWVDLLLEAREKLIAMLQNRDLPLRVRYEKLLRFADGIQPFLDEEDDQGFEEFLQEWQSEEATEGIRAAGRVQAYSEMVKFYGKLESLDQSWPEKMKELEEELPELLHSLPEFVKEMDETGRAIDYEHILVYCVFRYFMEAVFDSNILSPIRFAAASFLIILLLDLDHWKRKGEITLDDRIQIVKWYSKEIEYCPDNMEVLTEYLEEDAAWL